MATCCFADMWSGTLKTDPFETIVTAGAVLIPANDLPIVRSMTYITFILTA